MIGGRGVRLARQSAVAKAPLFVCVDLEEIGKSETLVRQASAVERDWLPEDRLTVSVDVEFDPARERVVAWRRTRWEDLVLEETITNIPAEFDASEILAREAALRFDRSLRLDEAGESFCLACSACGNGCRNWNYPISAMSRSAPSCRPCASAGNRLRNCVARQCSTPSRPCSRRSSCRPSSARRPAATRAKRQAVAAALRAGPAARAGRADSRTVWLARDPANCRRPRRRVAALAGPEYASATDHRRSGQLFAQRISGRAEGTAAAISQACLAGRSFFGQREEERVARFNEEAGRLPKSRRDGKGRR